MERLGTTERIAQGLAIVRVADGSSTAGSASDARARGGPDGRRIPIPDVGTEVVDDQLEPVGTVVDVFGPVSAPFATVTPTDSRRLPSLLGTPLYVR